MHLSIIQNIVPRVLRSAIKEMGEVVQFNRFRKKVSSVHDATARRRRSATRPRESGDLLFNRTYLAAHVADRDIFFPPAPRSFWPVQPPARAARHVRTRDRATRMQRPVHYAPAETRRSRGRRIHARLHVCTTRGRAQRRVSTRERSSPSVTREIEGGLLPNID